MMEDRRRELETLAAACSHYRLKPFGESRAAPPPPPAAARGRVAPCRSGDRTQPPLPCILQLLAPPAAWGRAMPRRRGHRLGESQAAPASGAGTRRSRRRSETGQDDEDGAVPYARTTAWVGGAAAPLGRAGAGCGSRSSRVVGAAARGSPEPSLASRRRTAEPFLATSLACGRTQDPPLIAFFECAGRRSRCSLLASAASKIATALGRRECWRGWGAATGYLIYKKVVDPTFNPNGT